MGWIGLDHSGWGIEHLYGAHKKYINHYSIILNMGIALAILVITLASKTSPRTGKGLEYMHGSAMPASIPWEEISLWYFLLISNSANALHCQSTLINIASRKQPDTFRCISWLVSLCHNLQWISALGLVIWSSVSLVCLYSLQGDHNRLLLSIYLSRTWKWLINSCYNV